MKEHKEGGTRCVHLPRGWVCVCKAPALPGGVGACACARGAPDQGLGVRVCGAPVQKRPQCLKWA